MYDTSDFTKDVVYILEFRELENYNNKRYWLSRVHAEYGDSYNIRVVLGIGTVVSFVHTGVQNRKKRASQANVGRIGVRLE